MVTAGSAWSYCQPLLFTVWEVAAPLLTVLAVRVIYRVAVAIVVADYRVAD